MLDSYYIHDIVPSKNPRCFTVEVFKWDSNDRSGTLKTEKFEVDITGKSTVEILQSIDAIAKAQQPDYMAFKRHRKHIRSLVEPNVFAEDEELIAYYDPQEAKQATQIFRNGGDWPKPKAQAPLVSEAEALNT